MTPWGDAVRRAVDRLCERNGRERFTLRELVWRELPEVVRETGTCAACPSRTLASWVRRLVKLGEVEELADGAFRRCRKPLFR